jgi:hypothetical protein
MTAILAFPCTVDFKLRWRKALLPLLSLSKGVGEEAKT